MYKNDEDFELELIKSYNDAIRKSVVKWENVFNDKQDAAFKKYVAHVQKLGLQIGIDENKTLDFIRFKIQDEIFGFDGRKIYLFFDEVDNRKDFELCSTKIKKSCWSSIAELLTSWLGMAKAVWSR